MKRLTNYSIVLKKKLLSFAAIAAMLIAPQGVYAEDIVISPTSGDIATQLETAISGRTVESITINLTKDGSYSISKSIQTPSSFTINGNGATIDASGNSGAFIKMDATPGVAANSSNCYVIDNITIKDININDIKERMFYDNGKKYVIMNFTVDNCVLKLQTNSSVQNGFDLATGGAIEFTIQNSTIYQTGTSNIQYVTRYNNSVVPDKAGLDESDWDWNNHTFWTYKNNTFYKVGSGQWHNGGRLTNAKAKLAIVIENNIWVDCASGSPTDIISRMLGRTSGFKSLVQSGNTIFYGGNKQNGSDLTNAPTFADAANGDFTLATSDAQYTAKTGDPRWLSVVSKHISDAGYATYCSPYALDFSSTGLTAYIAKVNGTEVTFQEVTEVPAYTGVLLKGAENDYEIPIIASSAADVADNAFFGVTRETPDVAAGIFVLLNGNKGFGFYKTTNTFTMGANTAYLPASAATARTFISLGNETTGVDDVSSKTEDVRGVVYDLSGRRVAQPTKGLYIVNGKKVIIK